MSSRKALSAMKDKVLSGLDMSFGALFYLPTSIRRFKENEIKEGRNGR